MLHQAGKADHHRTYTFRAKNGSRLFPYAALGGLSRYRCSGAFRSYVREVHGYGTVHEVDSSQTSRWTGGCQSRYEALSEYETGTIHPRAATYVRGDEHLDAEERTETFLGERKALGDVPNALAYDRILETGTNGYLVRQYLYSSLYDRMRHVFLHQNNTSTINTGSVHGRS